MATLVWRCEDIARDHHIELFANTGKSVEIPEKKKLSQGFATMGPITFQTD